MSGNWEFTATDEAIAEDLRGFIPQRVFDVHAHLYRVADLALEPESFLARGPAEVGVEQWQERVGRQMPGADLSGALFIPDPRPAGTLDSVNDYVAGQLAANPGSRGAVIVSPEYPRERVEACLDNQQLVAFKPYHLFSAQKPTFEAPLASYLPEWAWSLADERGLLIVLHLVKSAALADPDNQRQIVQMCDRYPNARLLLAHAARGFHAPNTRKGISALRGLQNVWFDTAAVCQPAAILAILHQFGPRRLMWGSDFPVSEMRGRCVTVGDGFAWLDEDSMNWDRLSPGCNPSLVGLESLRALREAAETFGLTGADLQDIFSDNARRLLGTEQQSGTVTADLYRHARQRMPGGTQLLSKRPEMFAPEQWPAYFREARGCEVWDLDGRHYYDMSLNGISACLLGFRDPDVTAAVTRRLNLGSMSTLNPPEEVELADRLCELHPWAEQVRFGRCGGEMATIAVRIARATTDRSLVAVSGYHGWHDWYLAANLGESDALRGHLLPGLEPLGVPRELRGTTLTFEHGSAEQFEEIVREHGSQLAAVVMEPCRYSDPEPGFLEAVREGARRCGALLVFDEVSIGWRLEHGGAHLRYGVVPDLAFFSKALGNGHPIAAVIGTSEAMVGAHDSFISSTQWTESIGPTAALATLEKLERRRVTEHVSQIGSSVRELWRRSAVEHGLPLVVREGFACLTGFAFEHPQAHALRTLYTQLMLQRGFLAGAAFSPTLGHTDEIVAHFGKAVDEVFSEMAEALEADQVVERLDGPEAHSGFRRLL
ncbi:MAG: aminotransferase class III-fold pyridoxal phosphate-dependent enzyme [Armatimonadota bacterium]|jgi:glutamate-1-semialdehyde 2,1-aminomutase